MKRRLGVAVVGLGVGAAHARAYVEHGCDLRWLYDLDGARARGLAAELGAGRPAESLAQILEDPEVAVVSIASFDDAHFEQGLAVLGAGKSLFVEKPLCRTLEELRELRSALESQPRIRLASNLVLRAAPLFRWLRERREEGELGTLYAFDGDYLYGRLEKITKGWRRDVPAYSVMLGGGVHLVDLLLWITGERPRSVWATGNRISTEGTAFQHLDFAAATFQFSSGLAGRITANFGSVHPHQHVLRVFGTRATVISDDCGGRLYESRTTSAPRMLDLSPLPRSKGELVGEFVAALESGQASTASVGHEFDVISACIAADAALAQGRSVEIEYV